MHLSVELFQPLNEAEELGNGRLVAPTCREEVRRDKVEGAKVVKCLVRGQYDGKAYPRGHLQVVHQCQAPVQLLREEGGVSTPTGGRLNRSLAIHPGGEPPPCARGVKGGVHQAHIFYKRK